MKVVFLDIDGVLNDAVNIHNLEDDKPTKEHLDCLKAILDATGAKVVGPIPLPTEKQVYTILRAVHKYKDSREQFEIRTHKRLLDIENPTKETIDMLKRLDLPSGVDLDVKM